jgi:hypothetical protein
VHSVWLSTALALATTTAAHALQIEAATKPSKVVAALLKEYSFWNSRCSEGSRNPSCERRGDVSAKLHAAGWTWCYDGWPESACYWRPNGEYPPKDTPAEFLPGR